MRAKAKQDKSMSGMDWAALAVCVALVVWILVLIGPAIDQELAASDARIAAHKVSLVSQ